MSTPPPLLLELERWRADARPVDALLGELWSNVLLRAISILIDTSASKPALRAMKAAGTWTLDGDPDDARISARIAFDVGPRVAMRAASHWATLALGVEYDALVRFAEDAGYGLTTPRPRMRRLLWTASPAPLIEVRGQLCELRPGDPWELLADEHLLQGWGPGDLSEEERGAVEDVRSEGRCVCPACLRLRSGPMFPPPRS